MQIFAREFQANEIVDKTARVLQKSNMPDDKIVSNAAATQRESALERGCQHGIVVARC